MRNGDSVDSMEAILDFNCGNSTIFFPGSFDTDFLKVAQISNMCVGASNS